MTYDELQEHCKDIFGRLGYEYSITSNYSDCATIGLVLTYKKDGVDRELTLDRHRHDDSIGLCYGPDLTVDMLTKHIANS